jgi:hypothetical protein
MSILTPSLLSKIRTYPHLPQNTWYFVAGVTFSVLNRPEEVGQVFEAAIRDQKDEQERLSVARRMREALIKSAAIAGFPKVIINTCPLKIVV